jgi:predicted aldo/keto reductase-like oxidoreductase
MSYGDNTSTNAHRWALDDDAAQPFFLQAVETGITFWDTANTYQHGTSETKTSLAGGPKQAAPGQRLRTGGRPQDGRSVR